VRLIDADDSHFLLLMEPAEPMTLADHLANSSDLSVEEAIEIAGDLAGRLAVPAPPDTLSLAGTTDGWEGQLNDQVAAVPGVLPEAVIDRARRRFTTWPTTLPRRCCTATFTLRTFCDHAESRGSPSTRKAGAALLRGTRSPSSPDDGRNSTRTVTFTEELSTASNGSPPPHGSTPTLP